MMMTVMMLLVLPMTAALPLPERDDVPVNSQTALNVLLNATSQPDNLVIIITTKNSQFVGVSEVEAPWGLGVFDVVVDGQDANVTQTQLSEVVGQARRLRQVSWSVTVVVVSDDPAFLAAFAEWSLSGLLMVWSTRLLVLTSLPLHRLTHIHSTLAVTNSMFIHLTHTPIFSFQVYITLPYTSPRYQPPMIAGWRTHRDLIYTSNTPLFPEKFYRLSARPELIVVRMLIQPFVKTVQDPDAPGGKRTLTTRPEYFLVEAISKVMNFTMKVVDPPDNQFGVPLPDGSWTGMMGLLMKRECDICLGPLSLTPQRAQVVDFTFPVLIGTNKIIAGRGSPEVDPWGFIHPLAPLVWVAILAALLAVFTVTVLLSCCLPANTLTGTTLLTNSSSFVRVLFQQDIFESADYWWWERLVLGVWMLMTLVLTRSYTGNLMSLLAVRYIPEPIQTLQDVVDNTVTMIVPKGAHQEFFFTEAESGVRRTIADLQQVGRFKVISFPEMSTALDALVRRGDHVLINSISYHETNMGLDFSRTGRCDYYVGKEQFLFFAASFGVPKDSPLGNALSPRIMRVTEAGLMEQWTKMYAPNITACLNLPRKLLITSSFALTNIWGMFAVVAVGGLVSVLVFLLEHLYTCIPH